ncbi:uncharacterized protein LOC123003932 [Tribolium madens]|uniref:uncharacterized protein LOC123003932 n=1 Tax=Tribolium madens TaxID=41895 RepID=UPI001CF74B16|nr:uncharacterized protein LOC123003932 [Tribolium madens]
MNKVKKNDPKVTLVRNTELPVPKTKLVIEGNHKNVGKKKNCKVAPKQSESNFEFPQLNSVLKITEKMERVKSATNVKVSNIAFSEKMTRKVNFPSDKPIYKDLIPLEVPSKSPPVITSREPLPQKDREPILSNYVKPPESREFYYQPTPRLESQPPQSGFSNLRLYKLIQSHQ